MKHTYRTIASEERDLIRRAKRGDAVAMATLMSAHDPFARRMARYYSRVQGYEFEDAYQAALLGMWRGIVRFKLGKKVRLLTYTAHWMRHEIKRALENSVGDIRVPVWQQQKNKMRPIRARRLDAPVRGPEGETEDLLVDTIDGGAVMPDDQAHEDARQERMQKLYAKALAGLNERERLIVKARLSQHPKDAMTLEAIGQQIGVGRERVRQIERDLKRKLRQALVGDGVRELLAA